MKLIDCPIGLFEFDGVLCLKTEYFMPSGRVEAYTVSGGECFCADVNTVEEFNNLEVTPIRNALMLTRNGEEWRIVADL